MDISNIIKKLDLEVIAGYEGQEIDVQGAYIGDLLSVVMANAKLNNIWITIQTHLNVVAVANLVELAAVIIAEDMEIDKDTISKANQLNIPLLKSKDTAYELACKLNELGV
ncbi:DRTGG domain-containing protein [Caldisalinibacter kiritimatiensis]|uniref:DRTGG domain-containing protein n=1 Tax=Caldisalinibacter kiritimatiensis TaxID=1304284 RepID=R1AT78_9FIRM|nr:DRTGG domain-containing protein [Caldisalinibacter kiritimatiensis]EOC99841.1 DRTGG domain-containing protein [Caldisalinibacter kiritimatiensis]